MGKQRPKKKNKGSRKKRSPVWKGFTKLAGDKLKCKFCTEEMSYNSSTSSMKNHLRNKHPEEFNKIFNSKTQPKLNTKSFKPSVKEMKFRQFYYTVYESKALNTFEKDSLKLLFDGLNNDMEFISKETMRKYIIDVNEFK